MKDRLFLDTAAKVATLADKGKVEIVVSALSYSTVHYLLSKYEKEDVVMEKLRKFKTVSTVSDLSDTIIDKGLSSAFSDFEDALQYYCALQSNCNILITRNGKDFKFSELPVLTGEEYLKSLEI